jgi:hypothetical protein
MRKSPLFVSFRQKTIAGMLACHVFMSCSFAHGRQDGTTEVEEVQTIQEGKKIKIALLLDTSNSMDGLIEQAKSQLWTLVNELSKAKCGNGDTKPDLQIALYEYGNDRLSAAEGYIRLVTPLTADLDQVSGDLFGLSTNGGSEFCGHVIQTSLRQLDWNESGQDLQIIFIAGNEGFDQGAIPYKKACLNARDKKVVVNTIYCGAFNQGMAEYWKEGAELTNGTYMSIEQDRKTVYVDSPYDKEIMQLNSQLNDTYIYYGTKGHEKKENQERQDKNAASLAPANSVQRTVSKTKHFYKAEDWDLVDAKKGGKADLKKIDKKSLPAPMQAMTEAQMEGYVEQKSKERELVKVKIEDLNKKREVYVKEKQKQSTTQDAKMLDNALLNAIKSQAKTKNMSFE